MKNDEAIEHKSKTKKVKIPYRPIVALALIFVLLTAAFFAGNWYSGYKEEQIYKKYPLLSRSLFADDPSDSIVNFEPLRAELRKSVESYGSNVSLYFEYLPTGTSIRIGDSQQLTGASLVKLPYVMNLYRLAENKMLNLNDTVTLKKEWLDNRYGDLYTKGEGYELSLREMARQALENSDDTAINGIKDTLDQYDIKPEDSSFNALDIDYSSFDNAIQMSARAYSSFLKCLYFACYLNNGDSQQVLDYLDHTTVGEDRIPKYLPPEVAVAHKIGVLGDMIQNDCGIVYVTNRNYLLCIMLKDDQEKGSQKIADISKQVYDYVTSAKSSAQK